MILFVLDDESTELLTWGTMVPKLYPDWVVKTFDSFEQMLRTMQTIYPTVIVVDLVMDLPWTGPAVCEYLQQHYPAAKLFVNTAQEGVEYEILSKNVCGATAYLSKNIPILERIEGVARAS